jgi:cytochrome c biogenesis protein CcmG/thiol:disulfide interchange protein DsbE
MKKQLLIFPSIIFFFILLVFFYLLIIDRDPTELPSVLIEKKVPRFETESLLNDKKFISTEEFANKTVIVNFFATWCKPCREEHPYIKRLSNTKGIKIIGINYKDNPQRTIKWLKELGNPYSNIAIDSNGQIGIDWGVYGLPETFIVNAEGIIKYRHVGPITKKVYNNFYSKVIANRE